MKQKTRTKLTRHAWEKTQMPWTDVFKNTLRPERASGVYNPIVYRDLKAFNELFRSLQIHVPEWESDPVWQMYILPHKQKISVDYTNIDGGKIAHFECLPYADLLGREFALRDNETGPTAFLQKIETKSPRSESPLLRVWRIWQKTGPSALSRYPFRLCTKIQDRPGWTLLRSRHTGIMAARFYEHENYEITGCGVRGKLHNQETGRLRSALYVAESRIRAIFKETGYWTGTLSQLLHDKSLHEMVCTGSGLSRHSLDSSHREQTSPGWNIPAKQGIGNNRHPGNANETGPRQNTFFPGGSRNPSS